jgi:chaperone required for assembly of F1-ATPase
MRELFDDIVNNQPLDPAEAARRHTRSRVMQRFYRLAIVAKGEGGYLLLLDGRPVKTPARRTFAAPTAALAEAVAAEWRAQGEKVDPTTMPLTRLANSIIDGVVDAPAAVAAEVKKYLGTDLVFYRAESPEGLVARQRAAWDPLLDWAHTAFGARFVLAQGFAHVAQSEQALAAAGAAIPNNTADPSNPWRLGALSAVTTLTGSALIALALLHRRIGVEEAWAAAHVDEDWNMEQWGQDSLAMERRSFRFAEMQAAARMLKLLD